MIATHTRTIALWALLLFAVQGIVMPATGQPANYGATAAAAINLDTDHLEVIVHAGHHHLVEPDDDGSPTLTTDSSNHTHEKADRTMAGPQLAGLSVFATLRTHPPEGLPVRRPFRLERPPRLTIA